MKKTHIIIALVAVFQTISAQELLEGSLDQWNGEKGEIIVGFMEPTIIGKVDPNGHFEIPLKMDFLEEAKKEVEAQNNKKTDGWGASLITLQSSFNCYGDSLDIKNGFQPIGKLSMMGTFTLVNMEMKKRLGNFMIASSHDFAKSILDYAAYKAQLGYYLDWYFIAEDGSVNGSCAIDSYALNQEEIYSSITHYDLPFKKGWNIVKYEVRELFTDREGHTYPKEVTYSILEELPSEAVFTYFPD